jgi:hypothetical protein
VPDQEAVYEQVRTGAVPPRPCPGLTRSTTRSRRAPDTIYSCGGLPVVTTTTKSAFRIRVTQVTDSSMGMRQLAPRHRPGIQSRSVLYAKHRCHWGKLRHQAGKVSSASSVLQTMMQRMSGQRHSRPAAWRVDSAVAHRGLLRWVGSQVDSRRRVPPCRGTHGAGCPLPKAMSLILALARSARLQ